MQFSKQTFREEDEKIMVKCFPGAYLYSVYIRKIKSTGEF